MASLQLSGLVSGFDWQSFVDNIMSLERAPAARLEAEKSANLRRAEALTGLGSRLADLRSAVTALSTGGGFTTRSASLTTTGSSWRASAAAGGAVGSFSFDVTRLATASRLTGTGNIGRPLAATADVSGLTIASLGTALPITAGTFSVNGAKIELTLADSLADVLGRISTATGGTVTATYDPAIDGLRLQSSAPIVLGAANDTSNFLGATRLANNGTADIASAAPLGAARLHRPLTEAGFATPLAGLAADGTGSFTVNGETISYQAGTDSLATVLARINASSAGVQASFDAVADRVVLTNKVTGDRGISIVDTGGGLVPSLGLDAGAALTRGLDATFSVNGGATLTSPTNTLGADVHGIEGLSLTATSEGAQTVQVATDVTGQRALIDTFISRFNALQTFLDEQSKIVSTNGKVTAGVLASNREVQSWGAAFRSAAFGAGPGTLERLESVGIDFTGGSSQLAVKDPAKLEQALRERSADVQKLFADPAGGLLGRMTTLLDAYTGIGGTSGGALSLQQTQLTRANESLDRQIADLDRRLVQRREQLSASFIAMESAQSRLQQMQTQLTNAFFPAEKK